MLTTGGGGLSGIDVADNDDVDMSLFLTAQMVSMMNWCRKVYMGAYGSPPSEQRLSRLSFGAAYPMMAVVLLFVWKEVCVNLLLRAVSTR